MSHDNRIARSSSPVISRPEMRACCSIAKLYTSPSADNRRAHCMETRFEETPTNAATFAGDPLTPLPASPRDTNWWAEADRAVNAFATAIRKGLVGPAVAAE
jgi:hypothetical protein